MDFEKQKQVGDAYRENWDKIFSALTPEQKRRFASRRREKVVDVVGNHVLTESGKTYVLHRQR